MSFFNGWVQGIVVAVIITIIIEMILPEGNSKKYIKIVLGIYVVFSIISPIIGKITGGKFEVSSILNMDKYAKELGTYEEMVKERKIEYKSDENIKQIYINKLEEDIKTKLKNKGYITKKIDLNIEEDESYTIKDATIYIERKNKEDKDNNYNEINSENGNEKEQKEKNNNKINIVDEVKIENINIGKQKEETKESNISFFERNEITKYVSETYGIEENKVKVY
ncbi:MAG: stage III sporulation protein AF [Clostridia bacterium]|nr:stage III sporulation protein AF [Clostridia bacterium]